MTLEELLEAARSVEPEPLEEAELERFVRAARLAADCSDRAGAVVAQARRAEPEVLHAGEVRAMAQRAAMVGRARHRAWTRRRVMAASSVAAALAAAAVMLAWVSSRPSEPGGGAALAETRRSAAPEDVEATVRSDEPADLDLPTGDHLVAAPGARFRVDLPEARRRRVHLDDGGMLFDVRRIDGGRFTVSTPLTDVTVLGTVFSVHASAHATTVRVYEGAVRVRRGDGHVVIGAGRVLHLGVGTAEPDRFAARAEAAADARRGVARSEPVAAVVPSTPGTPARSQSTARRAGGPEPVPPAAADGTSGAADADEGDSVSPATVRGMIAAGAAEDALGSIDAAIARGELDPWVMLRGDALRAVGRFEAAADAYREAAGALPPPRRQQAGFLEARTRAGTLDDPAAALRALREAAVTEAGSPLRERGWVLELQLLTRLGRSDEAAAVASAYLDEYPNGPDAALMWRALTGRHAVGWQAADPSADD